MLTILFIKHVHFLTVHLQPTLYLPLPNAHSLSLTLSLCLSAILPFAPFYISHIKDDLILCVAINWINASDWIVVIISKVTSNTKTTPVTVCCSWALLQWDVQKQSCSINPVSRPFTPIHLFSNSNLGHACWLPLHACCYLTIVTYGCSKTSCTGNHCMHVAM